MAILFANRARSTLAGPITNVATTLNVASGEGAEFPSPSGGDYFTLTLSDGTLSGVNEITHVTNRTGDTMTVVRAQEGTTGLAWAGGSRADNLVTAGSMQDIQTQNLNNQQQASNYAADTGTADAVVITLNPPPGSFSVLVGAPLRFLKIASPNTTTTTLNVNGLGPTAIHHADGSNMAPGELPASGLVEVNYNGTNFILVSMTHNAASTTEAETAVNQVKQITPFNFIYHPAAIKAWVIFHWSGSAVVITDSFNVASISRSGAGAYALTLSGGLTYVHGAAHCCGNGSSPAVAGSIGIGVSFTGTDPTFTVHFGDAGGSGGEASDPLIDVSVMIFGKVSN